MASDLTYIGSKGSVDMIGGGVYAGSALDIRGYRWGFDGSSGRMLRSLVKVDAEMRVWFDDKSKADELRRVADADIRDGVPGRLETRDGWSQSAYVYGSAPDVVTANGVGCVLNVYLVDGVWRKYETTEFSPTVGAESDSIDLPHDMPYDLAPPPATSMLEVGSDSPANAKFIVYGPVIDPYIVIAGNTYSVNVSVPDGGYLTIDPFSRPKRVFVTDAQGNVSDCFGCAERGSGEGGGSYIFEKVQPGVHEVSWSNSFGFDVTVGLEEAVPPWSS